MTVAEPTFCFFAFDAVVLMRWVGTGMHGASTFATKCMASASLPAAVAAVAVAASAGGA